jgi:hypothetical protein
MILQADKWHQYDYRLSLYISEAMNPKGRCVVKGLKLQRQDGADRVGVLCPLHSPLKHQCTLLTVCI